MVGGDFDATCKLFERNGNPQPRSVTLVFSRLIRSLQLIDLPLKGQTFTWSNYRDPSMQAKFDRFLYPTEWDTLCPKSIQVTLPNPCLDHIPIQLTYLDCPMQTKIFRFEYNWLSCDSIYEMSFKSWNSSTSTNDAAISLVIKLHNTRKAFKAWSANITLRIQYPDW